MSIFDWFKKTASNVEVLEDVIWMTRQAKFAGIAAATARCLAEPDPPRAVLRVAHFRDCLEQLQALPVPQGSDPRAVLTTSAEQLKNRFSPGLTADETQGLAIIVAERHPLPAENLALVEFAGSLPCRSRLVHHMSLEDPLLQLFAGPWVRQVLQQLGMQEDEPVESRMVSRRIQAALQKVQGHTRGEIAADSAEEWLQRNCPELWRKADTGDH